MAHIIREVDITDIILLSLSLSCLIRVLVSFCEQEILLYNNRKKTVCMMVIVHTLTQIIIGTCSQQLLIMHYLHASNVDVIIPLATKHNTSYN